MEVRSVLAESVFQNVTNRFPSHAMPSERSTPKEQANNPPRVTFGDEIPADPNGSLQLSDTQSDDAEENLLAFCMQSTPAILIAGLVTICTGILYAQAQGSEFFRNVTEAYMLAPPILGLKGNIEMTLVSRLSTQANLNSAGLTLRKWIRQSGVNLALLWVQAFALTLFAAMITMTVCAFEDLSNFARDAIVLTGAAITSTTIASLVLGSLMCATVYVCMVNRMNPDNIATPLSASLSDVATLTLFMYIGDIEMLVAGHSHYMINVVPLTLNLCITIFSIYISYNNGQTRHALLHGWFFLVLAVTISNAGGYILKRAEAKFPDSPSFQPLLAGLSGNRAAIQCSRLSTALHRSRGEQFRLADRCNPLNVFSCGDPNSRSAVFLIISSVPLQIFFLWLLTASYVRQHLYIEFVVCFALASLIQITLLIYLSHVCVSLLWRFKYDPDDCAIPAITSLADFSGTALLLAVFEVLHFSVPGKVRTSVD